MSSIRENRRRSPPIHHVMNLAEGFDKKSGDSPGARCSTTDFWRQLFEPSGKLWLADIIVYALIIGLGGFHFFSTVRASDFSTDDVLFADTARSLAQHGFYGINGYAETNLPPGFSAVFALLCLAGACSRIVFVRTMIVFGTLGFLASYELLRRQIPRAVSAAICLLLMSSGTYLLLVSQLLNPSFPYFFTTISALLVARKLESATQLTSRLVWGTLFTAFVVASLMFMSVGIALLGAIVASICGVVLLNRRLAFARLRIYIVPLLIGIAVQGVWMHRNSPEASAGIAAQEWPIAGFPHSYLAQLRVKSGNEPELGMATAGDFAVRILRHASEQAGALSEALLRNSITRTSFSVLVFVPLLLIGLGWLDAVWSTQGTLQDWYFAGYGFIYLVWPWNFEPRFAIAPLACLYLWRGGTTIVLLAKNKPRTLGVLWFPVALLLTICAWFWVHGSGIAKGLDNSGLQDEFSFVVWLPSAILAAWMILAGNEWLKPFSAFVRWFARATRALQMNPMQTSQVLALALVVVLMVTGVVKQAEIRRTNLDPNSPVNRPSADVLAAEWINSHTEPDAIVMARHVPIVYHFAKRKVIWFPPSSNPQLLMEGILSHKIDFVIVAWRKNNYYLPPDDDCFAPLWAAHPNNFRAVYQAPEFRIFQVIRNGAPQDKNSSVPQLTRLSA